MSRSLGAFSLTRCPPMRSSPSVMSSRPAIMLSVVDFPQPDGPTRMMNSPSAISTLTSCTARAPSGYLLVTLSRTISAMCNSPLDGAGGQARDDAALEEQHEEDDRDRDDHRRGGDRPGRVLELRAAGEELQRHRHRARLLGRGERDREQEVVPAEDEHEDRGGEHTRCRERCD